MTNFRSRGNDTWRLVTLTTMDRKIQFLIKKIYYKKVIQKCLILSRTFLYYSQREKYIMDSDNKLDFRRKNIFSFFRPILMKILKFYLRLNQTIVMDVIVKWRIWYRKITSTISMKSEIFDSIHIQGFPLMTLTAPVIITGKF